MRMSQALLRARQNGEVEEAAPFLKYAGFFLFGAENVPISADGLIFPRFAANRNRRLTNYTVGFLARNRRKVYDRCHKGRGKCGRTGRKNL